MIKAVIFDCFGVLTTDGWLAFREKYFTGKPDLDERAVASNRRVDAGLISYQDFLHDIASLAGVDYSQTVRVIENNVANEKLFDYIKDNLKSTYKIGVLSNAGMDWMHELFSAEQNELFDEVVLSYQVGVIKPDPVMYETIAAKLGVLPEECLFVDDQPRYVDGAKSVGMKAIHFKNTAQVIIDIEETLHA
jgi:epoxide hydrolase-like predicted phosphatase